MMQIAITVQKELKRNTGVDIIIPVESAWHHVVMNKLPFSPKVHRTVQLQDKNRLIFITRTIFRNKMLLSIEHYFIPTLSFIVDSLRRYLAVMTIGEYPVLLRGMEEQAQDVEVNGMLFKARPFIWTDENSALYFWVTKHHYLKYKGPDDVYLYTHTHTYTCMCRWEREREQHLKKNNNKFHARKM